MAGLVTGGRRNLYRNRVNLDENFHVELVDRPVARHGALTGFGLTAGCETTPTSSWEWFDVANAQEYATKLQEDGELRIRLKKARYGDWEVKYTEFLTDVSLRIEPEQGTGRRDPRSRWCVRIAEGFRLSWPSADEAR